MKKRKRGDTFTSLDSIVTCFYFVHFFYWRYNKNCKIKWKVYRTCTSIRL